MKTGGKAYEYYVSGVNGQDEGPLPLEEMRRRVKSGSIAGSTFVRRSDSEQWSTASEFSELGAKDVVVTRYDADHGPDALTQEAEAYGYTKEIRKGASWFFWIAALSIINSVAAYLGSCWGFALGLSTGYLLGGIGAAFGGIGPGVAVAFNLIGCGLFFYFGIAGWKGRFWPYTIGMFLYAGDALLPILAQDWISIAIHVLALFCLFSGFRTLMEQHDIQWNAGLLLKAGACVAALAGLGAALFFTVQVDAKQAGSDASAEPWAKEDVKSWPQLVLSHNAEFRDHSGLEGATAFLLELPDGEIVAVTARHLLGDAGGVAPELRPKEIDAQIKGWRLQPRNGPDSKAVEVSGLYGSPNRYTLGNEWLLLKVKAPADGELPARPLRLRDTPAKVGEPIFVAGVRYSNEEDTQEVFSAKVTSTAIGLVVGLLNERADLSGFSGAPVLDADGLVVAMVVGGIGEPDSKGTYPAFFSFPVKALKLILE